MNDHEFLTTIHDEFETNKTNKINLEVILTRLESRFDISSLFARGYAQTLSGAESMALRLYQNINDELKRH